MRTDALRSALRELPAREREEGDRLFAAKAYRSHAPGPNLVGGVSAIVNVHDAAAGRWYDVHIDEDDEGILAGCTCPRRGLCAHLWTLLRCLEHQSWTRREGEHPAWPHRAR
ncbi:MAG: hypothetical protein R3A51_19595 [Nannocystaceae bacterium]